LNYSRLDNVVRLFVHYLNRFPNKFAIENYVYKTDKSIGQIEQEIKNSSERKEIIKGWYVEFLGRNNKPTDKGIYSHIQSGASYSEHKISFINAAERSKRIVIPALNDLFDAYDYSNDLVLACTSSEIDAAELRQGIDSVTKIVDDTNAGAPTLPPTPSPDSPMKLGIRGEGILNGTDLINGLLVGIGHYTFLSNPQNHVKSVNDIASYGFNLLRVFSSLPRNPEYLPGAWWISPWEDPDRYFRILNETLSECKKNRIRLLYCFFDEVTRTDNVNFDRAENTWNGNSPSRSEAVSIIDYLAESFPASNADAFLPELMNEPPGDMNTWDSSWNSFLVNHLSKVTSNPVSIDYENPGVGTVLWEHVHPGYHSNGGLTRNGTKDVLDTLNRWRYRYAERNSAVHVGISTDGVREDRIWDTEEFARMITGEGFSCELMMSYRAPERWNDNDKRIVERFARGAGL